MFYNERFPELHPPIIQKKIEQPIIVTEKIQHGSGKMEVSLEWTHFLLSHLQKKYRIVTMWDMLQLSKDERSTTE